MTVFLKSVSFRKLIDLPVKSYSTSNLISILSRMPKDPKHVADAQKQRKKIKEKFSKYVPGRVTLQVLGTGAEGAPRSLYVFSDQSRYLFNCGEGTQRLAHEHKMKLAKLEHIFITQPAWKNIGGLPGTALTIQDVGVPQITLHGPKGLEEIFVATKRFVIIKDLQIRLADCNEATKFEDNVMTVQYVPLTRKTAMEKDDFFFDTSINEGSEDDSFSKDTQAGSSLNTVDTATSTRSEKRRRNRRRSRSRDVTKREPSIEDDVDYYAHERKSRKRHRSRSRSRSVSGTRTAPDSISYTSQLLLREIKDQGISMAFVCRLQPRPGTLNLEKCVKYGVPPGPLLGLLKSGENVTLPTGGTVIATDVCEPDDPGPIFIVVDCPTEDYLDSLTDNDAFKKHQAEAKNDVDMAYLVVHFTPKQVMDHPRYKEWIDKFSPSTNHLVLNDSNRCMGSLSVHRIQYKLNMLSEDFFPLLGDSGTAIIECEDSSAPASKKLKGETALQESISKTEGDLKTPSIENLSVKSRPSTPIGPYVSANTFFNFHLRPRKGCDRSGELKLTPSLYLEETMSVEGFPDALQELKQKLKQKRKDLTVREYPKLLFLGTGSCIPNKTRNTSGILLQTSDTSNIILDCGEGTYGQLVRFFGHEKANEILINIHAIYVSHLHADHHIGLIGLLQGRRKAIEMRQVTRDPVFLLAPQQILSWLHFYDTCFEDIENELELISNQDIILGRANLPALLREDVFGAMGMKDVSTVFVKHCPNAFGVAFTHKSGYKLTYSGDSMPCDNLITLGMDSDLLIHEATMEDELAHEAVIKMHSTTSQAIEVGRKMQAKHILLTHFSQRYAKLPRFNENFTENVGIAFDNMMVRLDELPLVPLLHPALKLMFADHYEELEHKAVKRQMRMERERDASIEHQQSIEKTK